MDVTIIDNEYNFIQFLYTICPFKSNTHNSGFMYYLDME